MTKLALGWLRGSGVGYTAHIFCRQGMMVLGPAMSRSSPTLAKVGDETDQ